VSQRINLQDDKVQKALLELLSAIERQDVLVDGIDITFKVKPWPMRAPQHRGTFFGTVQLYEQEV